MASFRSTYRSPDAALTAERALFARLITQGVSNAEACRRVGINRRTGTRWLYGRTITKSSGGTLHYPGVIGARTRVISPMTPRTSVL